ncbi:MAG TPA: hypothetical protein VNJ08_16840 [Bacteriovoracaceae bacterium]|nr:hypothetical protein [Bacteriovoracaceae bacterium]
MEVPDEIQGRYLERRKNDLEGCWVALENKNYVLLEKIGHQLKGNGSTFGFPQLSTIGNELEVGSKLADHLLIEKALQNFATWLAEQN